MVSMLMMEVTIVDVVQVAVMFNRGVPAIGPMNVRVDGIGQMRRLGRCRGGLGVGVGHGPIVSRLGSNLGSSRISQLSC
jgi:hypothetical protein